MEREIKLILEASQTVYRQEVGTSSSVIVSKFDKQTCKNEFESHWMLHSFGLVPHLSKTLSKLLYVQEVRHKHIMTISLCHQIRFNLLHREIILNNLAIYYIVQYISV